MSPKVRRIAVVLFNLGGPNEPKAVRPFLYNLFSDPRIIGLPSPLRQLVAALIATTREKSAQLNYGHMGGASPLLAETEAQAGALAAVLGDRFPHAECRTFIAMRYWAPRTREAAAAVAAFNPDEVVLLPLYPQYSTTTTASSLEDWRKTYQGSGRSRAVCCYPDEAGLIEAHARLIESTFAAAGGPEPTRLLFSAHGLPEKLVKDGDPYQWQVERSCAALVERLGGAWDWRICYQSRVGPLKWLGPSTPDAIRQAAGEGRGVLVVPIAFVSEHVETLVELDRDFAEVARAAGCPAYIRVPALRTAPSFIDGLADVVAKALARPCGVEAACGRRLCPKGWAKCPAEAA